MAKSNTISMVSKLTGVPVDTIRFYERKGLLPKPPRNQAGYRIYTPEIIQLLQFVKSARVYGFSLSEIEELLAIAHSGPPAKCDIRERLRRRIDTVDQEINHLIDVRRRLQSLLVVCGDEERCRDCRLVEAIS